MTAYEYRTSGVPLAYSACAYRVCLWHKQRTKFLNMLKKMFCLAVCQRMRPYATVLETYTTCAYNVPLAYVSVYRRMSDIFHTLAYASTIRNSVTDLQRTSYFELAVY
jgi:hypothetical protein